jgi:hypothetical protein
MPYCSVEGKFQGFDEELEIQIDSTDVTENLITIDVTMNRNCASCSQQVATLSEAIEIEIEHDCPKADDEHEPEFELSGFDDPQMIDEYVRETQYGKYAGKKGRFQTHILGASIGGTATCSLCNEEIELEGEVKDPASAFEVESSH